MRGVEVQATRSDSRAKGSRQYVFPYEDGRINQGQQSVAADLKGKAAVD